MKKEMNQLILLLFLTVSTLVTLHGQTNGVPQINTLAEQAARSQTNIMISVLGIDSARYGELYRINLNYQQQEYLTRRAQNPTSIYDSIHVQLTGVRDAKLSEVLTPDQYINFQRLLESWKAGALESKNSAEPR